MKSIRRQRHSRTGPHKLQLEPARVASDAAGRDLHIGSCACGAMTPTPPWDLDAIQGVYEMHLQLQQAATELQRVRNDLGRGDRR